MVDVLEKGPDLLIGLMMAKKSYRSRSNPDDFIQIGKNKVCFSSRQELFFIIFLFQIETLFERF